MIYAMVGTQADFTFLVSMVNQFISKVGSIHWSAVKHIIRYLQGTLDHKLCLGGKDIILGRYCNTDCIGNTSEHRSTARYIFFIGIDGILWNYKRHPTIVLSTMDAKYLVASQCTKEAIWLDKLLMDVGLVQEQATTIMCNNQVCITLAKNPTHHSRSKHIDV